MLCSGCSGAVVGEREREKRWMAGERLQVPDTLLVAPKKDALNVPLDYTVD